ncbi:MAG TPA: endonuclease/exonuclease/phosphatase family protein [Ardenticatenaceae bacterium]|nr:endonuclease/exonuclease/phosphatase family protein [Ardenticatenaceae bacterium]
MRRLADLTVLSVAAWAAARWRFKDRFGALAMLNAWSGWIEAGGLVAAGLTMWARRYLAGAAGFFAAAGAVAWHAIEWRSPPGAPEAPVDLRLFSLNLLHDHPSGDAFARLIQRERPDVVLLQELTPSIACQLLAAVGDDYAYRLLAATSGSYGFGILSRHPLQEKALLRRPGSRYVQIATLSVSGRDLDLYNCHLLPPTGRLFRYLGPTVATRLREQQIRIVAERIAAAGRPAVVSGDFNLTPWQQAYGMLVEVLVDSWCEAGSGPGVTWPKYISLLPVPHRTLPLLRLDYCFHTSELLARRAHVLYDHTGSDHCALVVDLAWRD